MLRIFLFASLIFFGCGSSALEEGCANISPAKMDAWVDLMPGGEASFLFAGILEMQLEDTCGLSNSLEGSFQLIQSSKKIHSASVSINLTEIIFDSEKKKYIARFGATPFEKMKAAKVNAELPVEFIFSVSCDGKSFEAKFENISIMKVY